MQIKIGTIHILWIFFLIFASSSLKAEEAEIRVLLVPELESEISSRINAEITSIGVKEGEKFNKGAPLVEFDCALLLAQLQKARIDLEAAAETHSANLQLQSFGSASQLDIAVSAAKVKKAQAEILVQETTVEKCIIHAPYSGRVVKLKANPYESVSQGDPILEIIDDQHLVIRLLVPSKWLTWIKPGIQFKVKIDETAKTYKAVLSGIGARINPVNQTIEVYGNFKDASPDLLAGMSGFAFFTVP